MIGEAARRQINYCRQAKAKLCMYGRLSKNRELFVKEVIGAVPSVGKVCDGF